ncbi:MAG: class I SAM-dependent methyltransferase, partial [Oscillospiraceae bacterium]|nr:class I SAM-dependent methyltransferase [Oscillospiraceae bacterium]
TGVQLNLFDAPAGAQLSMFPTEAEQIQSIIEAESAQAAPFASSLPQEDIDHLLRLGSNTEQARLKIVNEFMKQKPVSELTAFVKQIYHDGYGLKTNNGSVSSWADQDGLHIMRGTSVRYARTAQVLSWEDTTARIGELLEQGRFATNAELTEAPGFERQQVAQSLWYLCQDMSDEARKQGWLPTIRENRKGGFPEDVARLEKLLEDPETRQTIAAELDSFALHWRQNPSAMRFRLYKPDGMLQRVNELSIPRRSYPEGMTELPAVPSFITEDEIDATLSRGGSFEGGAGRIYSFWQQEHTPKEKADFLKQEYGTGGGNNKISHNFSSWEDHSPKGIVLRKPDAENVTLSWAKVAKRIDAMVAKDRYLTPEAKAAWEQAQSVVEAAPMPQPPSVQPLIPAAQELTQEDIDDALRKWNGNPESKRAVVRYMEQHGREKDTAAWLSREYGGDPSKPLHFTLTGTDTDVVMPWPKVQRRIAQLIREDRFFTEEEQERFDDIDPVFIRDALEQRGIVNGEVIDSEALDSDPFVRQVMADAEIVVQQPVPAAENFRIADDTLGVGGPKAKFRANLDAINLLKKLESEGRQATPEEQEVLSRYVGWGGLADAFDESKPAWAEEYQELAAALTPEEYAAARSSTLNAHYTSPTIIKAIYEAVGNMGFQTGNILEPSMGVGNFFGLLPEEMRSSRLYGVELDSITGRIAKQLYPKADITIAGFETTDHRDFYDLAVGNVPFGQYQVNDRAYNKLGFSIHDYFFAKTLDQVRPGGVIAFVTSRYTMDKQSPEVRKYIAQRAELLGAIRLPNNAFKAIAGTDVVSDIIFLQKRDRPIDIEPDWVHLGKNEDGFAINSYFLEHPEMILGRQSSESTQYGRQDFTVEPIEGLELADQLHDVVKYIHGTYQEAELPDLGDGEAIDTS